LEMLAVTSGQPTGYAIPHFADLRMYEALLLLYGHDVLVNAALQAMLTLVQNDCASMTCPLFASGIDPSRQDEEQEYDCTRSKHAKTAAWFAVVKASPHGLLPLDATGEVMMTGGAGTGLFVLEHADV